MVLFCLKGLKDAATGLAQRKRWPALLLTAALSTGLAASLTSCKSDAPASPTTPAPAATPAPASTTSPTTSPSPILDAAANAQLDELFNVMAAARTKRSFRAQVAAEVDGEKSNFELTFVAPDRYHMKGKGFEFIIIGQSGYLKLNDKWQAAPRDEADQSHTFNVGNAPLYWGAEAQAKLRPHTTLKTISDTKLNGLPAKLYEYEMTNALGRQGNNRARTWVTKDGLPRRTEMTSDYNGVKSYAVMTWTAYDVSLKIEAPPVA